MQNPLLVQAAICPKIPDDGHLSPNLHEVMDLRWVTRFELTQEIAATPRRFTPWLKVYLANHDYMIFAKEPDVERL